MTEQPAIDPAAPGGVHVQVADHIAAKIAAGELAPGTRLSGERQLAGEYGVSSRQIRRASALLHERGLVVTVRGKGTFVAPEGVQQ